MSGSTVVAEEKPPWGPKTQAEIAAIDAHWKLPELRLLASLMTFRHNIKWSFIEKPPLAILEDPKKSIKDPWVIAINEIHLLLLVTFLRLEACQVSDINQSRSDALFAIIDSKDVLTKEKKAKAKSMLTLDMLLQAKSDLTCDDYSRLAESLKALMDDHWFLIPGSYYNFIRAHISNLLRTCCKLSGKAFYLLKAQYGYANFLSKVKLGVLGVCEVHQLLPDGLPEFISYLQASKPKDYPLPDKIKEERIDLVSVREAQKVRNIAVLESLGEVVIRDLVFATPTDGREFNREMIENGDYDIEIALAWLAAQKACKAQTDLVLPFIHEDTKKTLLYPFKSHDGEVTGQDLRRGLVDIDAFFKALKKTIKVVKSVPGVLVDLKQLKTAIANAYTLAQLKLARDTYAKLRSNGKPEAELEPYIPNVKLCNEIFPLLLKYPDEYLRLQMGICDYKTAIQAMKTAEETVPAVALRPAHNTSSSAFSSAFRSASSVTPPPVNLGAGAAAHSPSP